MISSFQMMAIIFKMVGCLSILVIGIVLTRKQFKVVGKGLLISFFVVLMSQFLNQSVLSIIPPRLDKNVLLFGLLYAILGTLIGIGVRLFVYNGIGKSYVYQNKTLSAYVFGWAEIAVQAALLAVTTFSQFNLAQKINDGTVYDLVSTSISKAKIDEYIQNATATSGWNYIADVFILILIMVIFMAINHMILSFMINKFDFKKILLIGLYFFTYLFSQQVVFQLTNSSIAVLGVIGIFALLSMYYLREKSI